MTTLHEAMRDVLATVSGNIDRYGALYPDHCTRGPHYPFTPEHGGFAEGANTDWTTGFWVGLQWLCYEWSGDTKYRDAALAHARDFARRIECSEDIDTHDLGFLYTLSCVAAWRILGDKSARAAALLAATRLMDRFLEPAGIIQAWGSLDDPQQRGRAIVDSLMNMPLLTWASGETGDLQFSEAVRRHCAQLARYIVRPDGTTFHTFYWDTESGEALRGATAQGAGDDSCWARGQAWGIYGFALNFTATGDDDLLVAARALSEYFLGHLGQDGIPFWDLAYTDGSGQPRDSSAAAIAACGLHELARCEPDSQRANRYLLASSRLLAALIAKYTPRAEGVPSDALLLHSVYDMPKNNGVDEGCLWGDYFFAEALMRHLRPDWRRYW